MAKAFKTSIAFAVLALVILISGNVIFNIYNSTATQLTNEAALMQIGNDAVADTAGRIVAENKPWEIIRTIGTWLSISFLLVSLGFASKGFRKISEARNMRKE